MDQEITWHIANSQQKMVVLLNHCDRPAQRTSIKKKKKGCIQTTVKDVWLQAPIHSEVMEERLMTESVYLSICFLLNAHSKRNICFTDSDHLSVPIWTVGLYIS